MRILTSINAMDIEQLRAYCLSFAACEETTPFGPDVLVYKVAGKIFCLFNIENFTGINVKCDPEKATVLREQYEGVEPGYHMNKKHWNTLRVDKNLRIPFIEEQIAKSYQLVLQSLPKKVLSEIELK